MYGAVRNTEAWMNDGLCRASEPELWYSDNKHDRRAAKQVCGTCPVQPTCMQYGIRTRQPFGVWGGLDEKQRRSMQRSQAPVLAVGVPPKE